MKINFDFLEEHASTIGKELVTISLVMMATERLDTSTEIKVKLDDREDPFSQINILVHDPAVWCPHRHIFEAIYLFLTGKRIQIHFFTTKKYAKTPPVDHTGKKGADCVSLFSGGDWTA